MLKIEKTVLPSPEQWEIIIEGMRNPMNSWDLMDTEWTDDLESIGSKDLIGYDSKGYYKAIGDNDLKLMMQLAKGGAVHAKYRRMIPVYLTINAPFYWWKEFDTYKVGTVANSCSTMHKIHEKEFTIDDFSHEHLYPSCKAALEHVIDELNHAINWFLECDKTMFNADKKNDWWQMIQLLPTSYNQKRTVMLNYEVLVNIYHSRKNHKLDEWHTFCDWIEGLPYSELITGKVE